MGTSIKLRQFQFVQLASRHPRPRTVFPPADLTLEISDVFGLTPFSVRPSLYEVPVFTACSGTAVVAF